MTTQPRSPISGCRFAEFHFSNFDFRRYQNMSRAAQHTRNLTGQQLALQNQLLSQSNQQGQQDRSLMMPTIQSLFTGTGSRERDSEFGGGELL
jgi:hypothetical protein